MKRLFTFSVLFLLSTTICISQTIIDGICYGRGEYSPLISVLKHPRTSYSGNISIPASVRLYNSNSKTYEDFSVERIDGDAFKDCFNLTSVNIPNSVLEIGNSAFSGCSNLTSINIPNSVKVIEGDAFRGCSKFTSVTIPASVEAIGDGAFLDCPELHSVTINSDWIMSKKYYYGEGYIHFGYAIDNFSGVFGTSVKSVTIGDEVKTIGGGMFSEDYNLEQVFLPNGLTKIEGEAFNKCSSLKELNIPSGVTYIGGGAFAGCTGLTTMTLPNGINEICWGLFKDCSSLTRIAIPDGVKSINNEAFLGCTSLKKITIPGGVTNIDRNVFRDCTTLEEVTISEGVQSIGEYAFYNCSNIKNFVIPNSVTEISWNAFKGCTNLSNLTIGDGIKEIESGAFTNFNSLSSVNIGKNVTVIGGGVFAGCQNLKQIEIPDNVETIGWAAFQFCKSLESVSIGKKLSDSKGDSFSNCVNLVSISVDEENSNYDSRDNCNAIIETKTNTLISGCKSTIIPNSVEKIGNNAFSGCVGLEEVILPNGLTSIGESSFQGCTGLTKISLPRNVERVDYLAFQSCTNLKELIFSDRQPALDNGAFSGSLANGRIISNILIPQKFLTSAFSESTYQNAILYVPKGTKAKYKTTEGWKEFKRIVEFDTSLPILPNYDIAKTDDDGKTIYYEIEENNNDVKVTNGDYSGDVVIPKKIRHEDKDYDVKKIGKDAFSGCDDVTTVTIPESIDEIGEDAFDGCTGITDIYVYPATPPDLPENGFDDSSYEDATLHVPEENIDEYKDSEPWNKFKNIEGITPTNIQKISSRNEIVQSFNHYSLDGRKMSQSEKGLNIIKMTDGAIRKIMK